MGRRSNELARWSGWISATWMGACLAGCYGGLPNEDEDAGVADGGDEDPPEGVEGCEDGGFGPRTLRLLTRQEYRDTVADLLGIEPPDVEAIPVDPIVEGYDNNIEAAVVTARHIDAYLSIGQAMADEAVALDGPTLVGCMPEDPECARQFVERFGTRAFRRPLADDEIDHYLAQYDDAVTDGDFYVGTSLAIAAMLVSPHFLYRSELGEPHSDGIYRLTPHEVASSLSYTFWGTMPDAELFEAARSGGLDTPEGIEAQARRLLDDPRGRARIGAFATQWLGTGPLLSANKDARIYPSFSDDVREAMAAEQRAFVEYVVFEGDQTIEQLLTADFVFVNDALASFYGLPAPGSSELVRVEAPADSQRGGLLRMGAILASHAHPNESSPVKRGVFVRERLLCQPLPPPPPDVDAIPPELDPNATTRERFAQHTSDPACAGCHTLIDGFGFGFEAYDGVGAFRSVENGLPVDASGSVVGLPDTSEPIPFDGLDELSAVLAEQASVQQCAAEQFYRFAHGQAELGEQVCVVEALGERMAEGGGNLHEMFIELVKLENFTYRRG